MSSISLTKVHCLKQNYIVSLWQVQSEHWRKHLLFCHLTSDFFFRSQFLLLKQTEWKSTEYTIVRQKIVLKAWVCFPVDTECLNFQKYSLLSVWFSIPVSCLQFKGEEKKGSALSPEIEWNMEIFTWTCIHELNPKS